jgi:hypothetical protein
MCHSTPVNHEFCGCISGWGCTNLSRCRLVIMYYFQSVYENEVMDEVGREDQQLGIEWT